MFDPIKVKNDCVQWIRDFFEENGKGCNAVIGVSGGKDSSIAAAGPSVAFSFSSAAATTFLSSADTFACFMSSSSFITSSEEIWPFLFSHIPV